MMPRKKGVALLWVLLVSSVLLILSGTMVNFIVKEARSSGRTENSVKAYAAAKTGVEWALQEIKEERAVPSCSGTGNTITVDTAVTTVVCQEIVAGKTVIRSTGAASGSMRTIEHTDVNYSYNSLTNIYPATIPLNTGSFEIVLHFYHRGTPTPPWFVGLADATGANRLGLYFSGALAQDRFYISKRVAGVTALSTAFTPLATLDPIDPDGLTTAKLKYVKGEYATIRFEDNFAGSGTCLNIISMDLRNDSFGDLNRTKANVESNGETPAVQDVGKLNLVASNGAELVYITYFGYKLN